MCRTSYLRVEVEEGVDGVAELGLNLLAAAFEDVHGGVCLVAVLKVDGRVSDGGDLISGEQTHSIDEREIGHIFKVQGARFKVREGERHSPGRRTHLAALHLDCLGYRLARGGGGQYVDMPRTGDYSQLHVYSPRL